MRKIRLNESQFNRLVSKCVKKVLKEGSDKEAKAILSNSDPKNEDENDNFFDELYKDFTIERVYAKRSINSDGKNRGNITEILVRNY